MPTSDVHHYEPGDVVVVPFPFTDKLAEKRRPALVITGRELAETGLVWVLMITSAQRGVERFDLSVEDLPAAGLKRPCMVRTTKIACIEPARILRKAGRISAALHGRVVRRVRSFIPTQTSDRESP